MLHPKNTIAIGLLNLSLAIGLTACNDGAVAKDKPADTKSISSTNSATNTDSLIVKSLQSNIDKAGLNAKVISVSATEIPDIYLANLDGMPAIFTDKTGTYIIQGDIIKLDNPPINLTEKAQSNIAKTALAQVDKSEMIIFPAKGTTKAAVYVFSDPTCHFCQVLHKEIDKTTAQGIEVRYLAWPRSTEIIPLTEAIWCNEDRNQALTDAKAGKLPLPATCDNPVQKHLALGYSLGVRGTPAIFTESGEQIGGYLPSDELAKAAIAGK